MRNSIINRTKTRPNKGGELNDVGCSSYLPFSTQQGLENTCHSRFSNRSYDKNITI